MSTHNLCFGAKIKKKAFSCKPQFYYKKVGFKGVFISRTCFPDAPTTVAVIVIVLNFRWVKGQSPHLFLAGWRYMVTICGA